MGATTHISAPGARSAPIATVCSWSQWVAALRLVAKRKPCLRKTTTLLTSAQFYPTGAGALSVLLPELKDQVRVIVGTSAGALIASYMMANWHRPALLENAFKFTRHTTHARVEINGARDGENLAVQVRDNGAGFDPKYADRLFSPFQRLHAESEFAGTGIGLTTVKRVIHRHDGSITASGALGHGASFSITLPAATEPGAATANQAAP